MSFREAVVTQRVLVVAMALTSMIACGGSEQTETGQATQNVEEGPRTVPEAAGQMPNSGRQSAGPVARQMAQDAATPTAFESLVALLPDVSGWTKTDARGEQLSMPVAYSRAEAVYRHNDSRVELEVVDTALSQLLLAPMSMFLASGFSERSTDGFRRSVRIDGSPGMEDWNSSSRRGEVTKVVGGRFIVKGTGRDIDDLAPVRAIVEAVSNARLEALKK
jgi:hypothetical protein